MNKNNKNFINIIIIILLVFSGLYFYDSSNSINFRKARIHAVVVDSCDCWKRSIQYKLSDGNDIYFVVPVNQQIMIGDSVFKLEGSTIFNVYRMNQEGVFKFYREYDNEEPR